MFGDSHTSPDICVSPDESFWGLLASHMNIPKVMNCSRPNNTFDSICQLAVGVQQKIDWNKDLILIGIPHLERITVFDNYKNTEYIGNSFDTDTWNREKFDLECHRGLVALQNYGEDRELIIHHDRSWVETQTLRTVFLLTAWLDSKNANYMILNLTKDFMKDNIWGPSEFLLPYAINHPRCILFDNTYYGTNLNVNLPADFDLYGWDGHHGSVGHRYFFEKSLLPTMQRNKLC